MNKHQRARSIEIKKMMRLYHISGLPLTYKQTKAYIRFLNRHPTSIFLDHYLDRFCNAVVRGYYMSPKQLREALGIPEPPHELVGMRADICIIDEYAGEETHRDIEFTTRRLGKFVYTKEDEHEKAD